MKILWTPLQVLCYTFMCFLCFAEKSEPFPWRLPAPAPAGPGTSQQEIFGNTEKTTWFFNQAQKIEKLSKTICYFQTCKALRKIYSALVVQVRCTSCPRTPRTKSAILCNIKDQIKSVKHQTCTIRSPILVCSMHDFQDFSKSLLTRVYQKYDHSVLVMAISFARLRAL